MSIKEYRLRVLVIDEGELILCIKENGTAVVMEHALRAAMSTLLGLKHPAVPPFASQSTVINVPKRSVELGKRVGMAHYDAPDLLPHSWIKMLGEIAQYSDPISTRELTALVPGKMGTISGRVSKMKSLGLLRSVPGDGKYDKYMVTPEGHALLTEKLSRQEASHANSTEATK